MISRRDPSRAPCRGLPVPGGLLVGTAGALALLGVLAGCRPAPPTGTGRADPAVGAVGTVGASDPLARDVERLGSPEFEVRARAAERLVAVGEGALGVLGAAGEGRASLGGGPAVGTTAPVAAAILERLPSERVQAALGSPWPVVRRSAAEELGRRGRWAAVPPLIDRLADPDLGVRGAANASLRRLTNRFVAYDPAAPETARRRAAERWREWWAIEGRVRAAAEDPPSQG